MAFSRLPMRKILEVLRLHHEGRRSHREIARAVVADRVPRRGVRGNQEAMDSGVVGLPIRLSRRTSAAFTLSSQACPCLRLVVILIACDKIGTPTGDLHPITSRPCWAHTIASRRRPRSCASRFPVACGAGPPLTLNVRCQSHDASGNRMGILETVCRCR